jgi:NAD+ kinase
MKQAFKRVGVTVKSDLDQRDAVVADVLEILRSSGAHVVIDKERMGGVSGTEGLDCYDCTDDIDLLIVMGGDGTILRAVRELKNFSVPVLCINRGAVGFLAEMRVDEAGEWLPRFLHGEGVIEERNVLRVVAKRGAEELYNGFVLNEAVISQGSIARLIDLKTTINGEDLTTFRADGLIISTPTGSTAYTLAAGGPIVYPELSATILTPINSHTFSQKPIVIPGSHRVRVEVMAKENKFQDTEVSLTLDGQTYVTLQRKDVIEAYIDDRTVKFLRRAKETFYGMIRAKLKWGDRPED